ncbi:hypothetical protein SY88_00130 [Clostridiales bacterium PH28_bin88]|nr:hypothetical protein SY88_00130 [Clostridiales bacterium PH28_bin88]
MVYFLLIAFLISIFSSKTAGIGIPEITSLVIIVFTGMASIIKILSRAKMPKPLVYFWLFGLVGGISLLWALANSVEIIWWARRFAPIMMLVVSATVSYVYGFGELERLWKWWLLIMGIGTVMLVQDIFPLVYTKVLQSVHNLQQLRFYGGGYFSALLFSMSLPYILLSHSYKGSSNSLGFFIVIITFISSSIALVISYTRTYWLATVLTSFITFLVFISRRMISWKRILQLGSIILLITILLMVLSPSLILFATERFEGIFSAASDLSFLDRIEELKGIWTSSMQNPVQILFGHGLGAKFVFYSVNPFSWNQVGWIENDYSHNYYAYTFYATGIVGLLLFLKSWVSFLRICLRRVKWESDPKRVVLLTSILGMSFNLLFTLIAAPPLTSYEWSILFGIVIGTGLSLL